MGIRLLVIAPYVSDLPELDYGKEIAQISDFSDISVTSLAGPVTRERISNRLSRASYDAVLWIGHGKPGQLIIQNDNESVTAKWLADQLNHAGVSVVVLSACNTSGRGGGKTFFSSFVDEIPALGIDLITMMAAVSDKAAMVYDIAFFEAYAKSLDVYKAHNIGLEAISHFPDANIAPQLHYGRSELSQHISDLSNYVQKLEGISGNDLSEAQVLIQKCAETICKVDDELAKVYQRQKAIQGNFIDLERQVSAINQRVFKSSKKIASEIFSFLLVFVLVYSIAIKEIRDFYFNQPVVTFLIVFGAIASAGFVYWLGTE